MYVLDSCVCIDLMRGNLPIAYDLMRRSDPKMFAVPAIVVAELEFGIENSSNPERTRMLVERFLAPFRVLPFTAQCAHAYGKIRSQLKRERKLIGPNDMLIAATAMANQATLVSNNRKEFARIQGLELESWYEVDI